MARKKRRSSRKPEPEKAQGSSTTQQASRKSRREKFNRERRASWIKFLFKMSLFVVPIVLVTGWIIYNLTRSGLPLPILTLDYEGSPGSSYQKVWEQIPFSLAPGQPLKVVENEKQIVFGGPDKNVAVVFCEVLGDARRASDGDSPFQPRIFVPKTQKEHRTRAYQGLLEPANDLSWTSVKNYLEAIVKGIDDSGPQSRGRGNIIVALDVAHPDLPSRLPPQANEFIHLVKKEWPRISSELEAAYPDYQVFLWLSHSRGQMSYFSSDPAQVSTFFKRRLEMVLTGDIPMTEELQAKSRKEFTYADVTDYLTNWVEIDSFNHKLAQSPTFLPANSAGENFNFKLLEFSNVPDERPSLFSYPTRLDGKYKTYARSLDDYWKRKVDDAERQHWDLENPLLTQQVNLILLQMERLWYVGLGGSTLWNRLESKVKAVLDDSKLIAQYQHTIHDRRAELTGVDRTAIETAEKSWDQAKWDLKVFSDDLGGLAPATAEASKAEMKRVEDRKLWMQQNGNWRGAYEIWYKLARSKSFSRQQLADCVKILEMVPFQPERADEVAGNKLPWNEVAYLKRIQSDLIWPEDASDLARLNAIAQQSIVLRDQSNRFLAELSPVFVQLLQPDFVQLEARRRLLEDRLFAGSLSGLKPEMDRLSTEYGQLINKHSQISEQHRSIQAALIEAPHDLRYCTQSLAVIASREANSQASLGQVAKFEQWLNQSTQGFADQWTSLGSQMIKDVVADPELRLTAGLDSLRKRLFQEPRDIRLATNPWADNDWLKNKQNEGNQNLLDYLKDGEGNLLGRRLLAWPGLDPRTRATVRAGLNSGPISLQGAERPTLANGEVADALSQLYAPADLPIGPGFQNLLPNSSPIDYAPPSDGTADEGYFYQVALGAHQRFIAPDEENLFQIQMARAVNDFHARKSDLAFGRIAADLWGPVKPQGLAYVTVAAQNHLDVMNQRVKNFGATTYGAPVKEVWLKGPMRLWPQQTQAIDAFVSDFQSFEWPKGEQRLENADLAVDVRQWEGRMVFRLSPENKFESLYAAEFKANDTFLDTPAFRVQRNTRLDIYLRGHRKKLNAQAPSVVREGKTRTIRSALGRYDGVGVSVKRVDRSPVAGHITLVIDCSGSMGQSVDSAENLNQVSSRMARAKEDVIGFLEGISQRNDIELSMIAIGTSRKSATELGNWTEARGTDGTYKNVWVYNGNGQVVTPDKLKVLRPAIMGLKPRGKTPILRGITTALALPKGLKQNLIVLLTDGCEFDDTMPNDEHNLPKFDQARYDGIVKELQNTDRQLEVALFSYISEDVTKMSNPRDVLKVVGISGVRSDMMGIVSQKAKDRVRDIEDLAIPEMVGRRQPNQQEALKSFLNHLLPKPVIRTSHKVPKELQFDPDDRALVFYETIGIKDIRKPGQFEVEVKFTDPQNAAKVFTHAPALWQTVLPLEGNEELEFEYDPSRPTLTLKTEKLRGAEFDFASISVVVAPAWQDKQKPGFQLAATERNKLTPAPQAALVRFFAGSESDRGPSVVLQDFALTRQDSSNVHPIKFPRLPDSLRRDLFPAQEVNMELLLSSESPNWTKIRIDDRRRVSANRKQVDLVEGEFQEITELLPQSQQPGFRVSFRRVTGTEHTDFTLRVEPAEGAESSNRSLDQWLVNTIEPNGRIDRVETERRLRNYRLVQQPNEDRKQLLWIEHEFRVGNDALKQGQVQLGIAKLSELSKLKQVLFEKHLER